MGGQTAEIWLDREDGLAMTACCLLAPAMDWARLGLMMKDRGRINGTQVISAEWIDAMLTPSPQSERYGYFTWLGYNWAPQPEETSMEIGQSEPFITDDLFMFLGRGGQRVYVSREHDLVVVRLGPHSGMTPLKEGWANASEAGVITPKSIHLWVPPQGRITFPKTNDFGSFDVYVWQFVEGRPLQNRWRSMKQIPAKTELSDSLSKVCRRIDT